MSFFKSINEFLPKVQKIIIYIHNIINDKINKGISSVST